MHLLPCQRLYHSWLHWLLLVSFFFFFAPYHTKNKYPHYRAVWLQHCHLACMLLYAYCIVGVEPQTKSDYCCRWRNTATGTPSICWQRGIGTSSHAHNYSRTAAKQCAPFYLCSNNLTRPSDWPIPPCPSTPQPLTGTTLSCEQLRDKIYGLIFGHALGDAIGLSSEFMVRVLLPIH